MNKKEFTERVKLQCPQELLSFIEKGIESAGELLGRNGVYEVYDIPKAIQYIARLAPHLASKQDDKQSVSIKLTTTAQDLITSDFLADKLTPWVETVRVEIFGLPQPPFSSLKEAEKWIIEDAQKQHPVGQYINWNEFKQTLHHSVKVPTALAKSSPLRVTLSYERAMEYLGSDGKTHRVFISEPAPQDWAMPQMRQSANKFTPLNWLENEARAMTRATGFIQSSLVQFVLTGTQPMLPRFIATGHWEYQALPSGEVMQPMRIDVEIRSKDLTFNELHQIYNGYRSLLPLKKSKKLNKRHLDVYQLVREMGSPPNKAIVVFWKSVRQRWNELHEGQKDKQYSTWKGIQKAYSRSIEKLNKKDTL